MYLLSKGRLYRGIPISNELGASIKWQGEGLYIPVLRSDDEMELISINQVIFELRVAKKDLENEISEIDKKIKYLKEKY